jgi:hypothetical protein
MQHRYVDAYEAGQLHLSFVCALPLAPPDLRKPWQPIQQTPTTSHRGNMLLNKMECSVPGASP